MATAPELFSIEPEAVIRPMAEPDVVEPIASMPFQLAERMVEFDAVHPSKFELKFGLFSRFAAEIGNERNPAAMNTANVFMDVLPAKTLYEPGGRQDLFRKVDVIPSREDGEE